MTPEQELKFKSLRHRFYRLGKHGPPLLQEMGLLMEGLDVTRTHFDQTTVRSVLFEVVNQGRLAELETLIDRKEREILEQIGHKGDPCEYCGVSQPQPGPCPVRKR